MTSLLKFAEDRGFSGPLMQTISLGQGQVGVVWWKLAKEMEKGTELPGAAYNTQLQYISHMEHHPRVS